MAKNERIETDVIVNDKASSPLSSIMNSFKNLESGSKKSLGAIASVGKGIFSLGKVAVGAAAGLGLSLGAATVGIEKLTSSAAELDALKTAFTRLGDTGVKQLEEISDFAKTSGRDMLNLQNSAAQLARSMDPKLAVEFAKAATDLTYTLGTGDQEITKFAEKMSELSNKTKISGGDIEGFAKDIGGANIGDIYASIAKVTGLSIDEVNKAAAEGRISVATFQKGILDFASSGKKAGEVTKTTTKNAGDAWQNFKNQFTNSYQDAVKKVSENGSLTETIQKLSTVMSDIASSNAFKSFIDGLISAFSGLIDITTSTVSGLMKLSDWAKKNSDTIKSVFLGIGTAITIVALPALYAYVVAMGAAAIATATALLPVIAAAAPLIALGVAIGAVVAVVYKYWDDIAGFFSDVGTKAFDFGKNIIEGLVNGIINSKQWLIDTIKGIANSVTDTFKDILGISSPSKVFEKFGMDTSSGFRKGLEASPAMSDSTEDQAVAAINAMSSAQSGNKSINDPIGSRFSTSNNNTTNNSSKSITLSPGAVKITVAPGGVADANAAKLFEEHIFTAFERLIGQEGF